jgi:hypothetical protein
MNSQLCLEFSRDFSSQYGDPNYPIFVGSGGGGQKGGHGGGIIYMGVLMLQHNGHISSNGGSVLRDDCKNGKGSGAGSGGSVQIYIGESIFGKGRISANGGNSWDFCGEGGGGRMIIHKLSWENITKKEEWEEWRGNVSVKRGMRTNSMNKSELQNGNFTGTDGSTLKFNQIFKK